MSAAPMPDQPLTIFISYARSESAFVDRLEADVRHQGFDTWVDRHGLQGGQQWRRELQAAIDRSQVVLVVLSPEAAASEYVQIEYGYASDEGKVVIPLYYRSCHVPMELRGLQWIDFQQSYEQALAALLQSLHAERSTLTSSVHTRLGSESEHPWNVPFQRNPFFTGRGALLERLYEQLGRSHRAALTHSQALTGLGGIGKTQTAVEYAYRYRQEYQAVFWVRAASRETLVADFVALAELLALPEREAQDQTLIVAGVKRWLIQQEGWLLILDNADDLQLLADFLPSGGKGDVLLTTRAQATGRIAASLPVEKLEASEGLLLLLQRARLLAPDEPPDNVSRAVRTQAQVLVKELDGLPLALDQAGAYIEEIGCSLEEYLTLYHQRRSALLQRQSSVPTDYPHTVASTWALSFEQVEQADPAAAELLRLCAFLDPDAIPEEIITAGAQELGAVLSPVASDPLLLNEAFQVLRRYSLVKRDPEAKLLNLHRLVQVVLKDAMDDEMQQQWTERTVKAVNAAFPEVKFDAWPRCQRLLAHAQACAALVEHWQLTFPEAAQLLNGAGDYLNDRAEYSEAEPLLQRALAIREQVLGPTHPDMAQSLTTLAVHYYRKGKYEQAEPLFQRVLAIREQVYGPDHSRTASSLDNLGLLYIDQGKYEQAESLCQRALAIYERVLGPDHLDTANTLNNLGILYYYQSKYEQAEPFWQRTVAIYERVLGPDHLDNAMCIANLANLYMDQGKYEQAEPLYQRALAIEEPVLGPDHPDIATTLNNLGLLYTHQGKYEQAEPLCQRALAIREQVLGPDHPDTATSLDNLASLHRHRGQYELAEPLCQRALAIREQVLGPDHLHTISSLSELANLYKCQGKYEQAEPLYVRSLALLEHTSDPEQPQTAAVLHDLADLYTGQGKYEQAEPLFQRALAIREQALGSEHPDTVATREAHTNLLHKLQEDATRQQEAMSPGE